MNELPKRPEFPHRCAHRNPAGRHHFRKADVRDIVGLPACGMPEGDEIHRTGVVIHTRLLCTRAIPGGVCGLPIGHPGIC